MNNLKEKIEKALDKCDVVVVSVLAVGKSDSLLKEIAKKDIYIIRIRLITALSSALNIAILLLLMM